MGHVFFAREVADGEFLGDYQVLNVLGRGPTGCTYHVTSVSLGKEFALKSFVLGDAVDLSWVDRLEAETALLGKLAHPHIDRVVNSGKSRNLHFLLKDYVHDGDGNACDLRKYLERHGGVLSHFQAYHVVDQVISALQWAEEYQDPHHTGLIHGNLKPENILMGYLSQTGAHLPFEIRLTDFQPYGLMDGQVVLDTYRQWKVGVSLGYPGEQAKLNALEGIYRAFDYFPPEKMLSVQGDMFSLGVIIYEMLTGQLPYGRFASPRELRPELPLGWDVLIERALQASPRLRPESWAEFRAVFEETDRGILREISQEFQEENVQEAFPRKERHSLTPAGMVYIPGGTLLMGSGECGEDALPQHEVEVSGFYLDRTPVTVRYFARFVAETGYQTEAEKVGEAPVWSQGQWKAVPGACWKSPHGLAIPEDFESHPVTQVSFLDAEAYAAWAGRRLPTEQEWEYAAKGGRMDLRFPWGNSISLSNANYSGHGTCPVMRYQANGYGLYDMAGNVWEWTASWYEAYPGNFAGSAHFGIQYRVVRGGAWLYDGAHCHVAYRNANGQDRVFPTVGFRTARDG